MGFGSFGRFGLVEVGVKPVIVGIALVLILNQNAEVHCTPFGPTDGWPHLTLYQHENHQGKHYHQEVGPRCYNLPKVMDDEASSLRTHHKCVKVCVQRDCKKCVKMSPGTPGHFALREIGFNDAISSFTGC